MPCPFRAENYLNKSCVDNFCNLRYGLCEYEKTWCFNYNVLNHFTFSINMKKISCLVLFCCAALLLHGCGPDNPYGTVVVTGTVTVDGEPMEGVTISFVPSGDGMSAFGLTDANGSYRLTTAGAPFGTGAMPGTYSVTFTKLEPVPVTSMADIQSMAGGQLRMSQPVHLIPQRYSTPETAGFDPVEVVTRGRNHFEFNLESR